MLLNATFQSSSLLNFVNVFEIIVLFLRKRNCVNLGFSNKILNTQGLLQVVFSWCNKFSFSLFEIDGGSFFQSLNLPLWQRILITNSLCMLYYYICSRWYFDVDINIVPCKTCRKVILLMTWLGTRVLILRSTSSKPKSIRLISHC